MTAEFIFIDFIKILLISFSIFDLASVISPCLEKNLFLYLLTFLKAKLITYLYYIFYFMYSQCNDVI
jgi:hypothetical protein